MRRRYLAVLAAALTAVSACNNDKLTDINVNPNNPTDAPIGPLFTQAIVTVVPRWMSNFRSAGLISQQTAEVQYPDEDRYVRLDPASTGGLLTAPYSSDLEDFQQVIKKADALNRPATSGPAMAMQAWDYSYMTDTFGDIPFSQALKADSGIFLPQYDAQKDVYTGLFTLLNKAVSNLASSAAGEPLIGSADPIYQGNVAKWETVRQFAACPSRDADREHRPRDGECGAHEGVRRPGRHVHGEFR